MAKRKVIRKSSRPFTYTPHYYSWGGDFKAAMDGTGAFDLKSTFSGGNVAKMLKGGLASSIGSAVGNIAGGAIGGGLESGAGSAISNIGGTIGGAVSAVNPVLGGIISAGTGVIGGLTNRMFGSKLNKEKITEVEGSNKAMNTVMVDSSSADSIEGQWANQDFGADFSKSDIGKDGWFSSKAKKKYKALKKQQDIARNRALTSYEDAAEAADIQSDLNAMANFAAFGGPLGIWGGYGSGAIGYELAKENLGIKALNAANKGRLTSLPNSFESPELNTFAEGGKIHIKPSKRGTFTAAAKKHGKSVQSFASQVLANKEDYSPAMVKKANFARNAAKWKHALGGELNDGTPWYYPFLYNMPGASFKDGKYVGNRLLHPIGGSYGGGRTIGSGATSSFNVNDYSDLTFNEAFDRAYNNKEDVFRYGEKLYNTKKENNPVRELNNRFVGGSKNRSKLTKRDSYQHEVGPYGLKGLESPLTKFSFGGELNTNGADFSNGQIIVGNGGTHEENPMEGVPMGMDAEGNPNLVEQGEVIFNDYVFSNRLFADGGLLESFNLPKSYDGHSFAAIAEKLGDESKERPNDPISKRGLLSSMSRLQQAQETVRQQTQKGQEGVQYAHGGRMGTLFDGLGQYPNHLLIIDDGSVPEGTMFDPISNKYVFTGYQDSDANPLNFGSGITPSGEWVEEPKYMARAAKRAGYNVGSSLDDYNKNPIKAPEKKKSAVSRLLSNLDATDLRYAPVVGAAIGLGQNLFSRPDYTSADTIFEAANQAGNYTPIEYTPIGNYLQYKPFDRNFYLNKLNAQAGATRRAIMNTTSPSRNAALLAADYNAQGRVGDLARQAEEYNLAQRQAIETFNRGTNQTNAEMGLKAAMANQEAALKSRSSRLSGVAQAMAVRDAVDARRGASMSANLTNFFNSLGDIGREEYSRNMIMSNPALYYSIDSKGNITYKNGYESLSEAEKKEVRDAANKAKKKKAKGGYLTIKKK